MAGRGKKITKTATVTNVVEGVTTLLADEMAKVALPLDISEMTNGSLVWGLKVCINKLHERVEKLESALEKALKDNGSLKVRIAELSTATPVVVEKSSEVTQTFAGVVAQGAENVAKTSKSVPRKAKSAETSRNITGSVNPHVGSSKVISKGTVSAAAIAADFSSLCLTDPPHVDFCVRGLPRNATMEKFQEYVESLGVKVRFIRIHQLKKDDPRGTTFARVGTFEEDSHVMMDGTKWLKNLSVRRWKYFPKPL